MKKTFHNKLILSVILITAFFFQSAHAVSVPGRVSFQEDSTPEPAQKLKEADLQLRKIVSEIEGRQGRCEGCLENVKQELQQVQARLENAQTILDKQARETKPKYCPGKIAWVLGKC